MAQIHNLESKTRYGSRYVAGFIILISSILLAGWVSFFTFLPIKSGMEVVTSLEEKFLPRAEGMVLNFVSLCLMKKCFGDCFTFTAKNCLCFFY